ncbi:MAG: methyltransferase [Micromonosporaceae bacterium]
MTESGYTPSVSAEYAERVRRWHEDAYRMTRTEGAEARTFDFLGRTLVVPPQVHPINPMSHLLGETVLAEVRESDRVLDMGTGCGVNAILAASASRDVLAVDVNPVALQAARDNAARNGVAERVTVRHSDVYADVTGLFDLMIFDPPFRWFAPRDLLERASTDENYQAMTAFFRGARAHLTPGGRMLICFGSSGDLAYLKRLAAEEGFAVETVRRKELTRDGWTVAYYTFRMTPEQP